MFKIPLSEIKRIESIVQDNNEYISLSQGALKVGGIPKQIKQHLQEVLKTDKTDYYQSAWGIKQLRTKLAEILSKKSNTKINFNQIIITHGCIGALSTLFLTLLKPNEEVILPEPTYPAYEKLTLMARGKSVFISCLNTKENTWQLNIEKIKKATNSKTKIIIFSNPWNPLGIIINKKTILELIKWCEKKGIYLIVDEAYKNYVFNKEFESTISLINKSENIINVASFSKNMAMSGWRVGYMVLPKKLSFAVGCMQDALLNCPNIPAQYAALYALDHPELSQNFYNIIKNNLGITHKILKPLVENKIFEYEKPNAAFYIFFKTKLKDSTQLCNEILNTTKVSLIPGKYFGESGKQFIRLCYARDTQILKEGLNRILKFFSINRSDMISKKISQKILQ